MGVVSSGGKDVEQEERLVFKHEALAMFCYFVMGAGFLTGWNAFLTASDYFNAVFPGRSVDRVFTVTYLPVTLAGIGLVTRFKASLLGGRRPRILVGYALFTLSCAAVPLIDALLVQSGHTSQAYALVLVAVALVAVGDGLTQPTVYADAALLPDKFTQAVVMGAAASGVTIGVIRLLTKGSLPQTEAGLRTSTQIYFALSALITAASVGLYELVMPRLDVVAHFRGRLAVEEAAAELALRSFSDSRCGSPVSVSRDSFINISVTGTARPDLDVADVRRRLSGSGGDATQHAGAAAMEAGHASPAAAAATPPGSRAASPSSLLPPAPSTAAAASMPGSTQLGALTWQNILRLNWRLCVAVFMLYTLTLSIFPGFLAEDVHSPALGSWYPVLLIFSFNVSDFAGRCVPVTAWLPRHTTLLAMALCRLGLIPLFAGLSVAGLPPGASEPVFFLLTLLLGGTNGWLTQLIFTAAPRGLNPSAAELAGCVNVFCELGGLNAGAYLGWLWTI